MSKDYKPWGDEPPGNDTPDISALNEAVRPLGTAVQIASVKSAAGTDSESADHAAPTRGAEPAGDGTLGAGYAAIPRQPDGPGPAIVDITKRGTELPRVTIRPAGPDVFTRGTLLAGRGLYFDGQRILQPNHQANVVKLFADEGYELVTPDEIKQLRILQANYERLMQGIAEHTNETARKKIQEARKILTANATDEGIKAFEDRIHSREHLESLDNRDIRLALKHNLETFNAEEVHPVVSVILNRAAAELVPIIDVQEEKEKALCEKTGIPFTQSPCLLAIKYAAAKIVDMAVLEKRQVYPSSPRAQVAVVYNLTVE